MKPWNISGPKSLWDFAECHSASVSPVNHAPHNYNFLSYCNSKGWKNSNQLFYKGRKFAKFAKYIKNIFPRETR